MSALPRAQSRDLHARQLAEGLDHLSQRTLKEVLDFQNELFEIQNKLPFYYKFKIVHETFWAAVLLVLLSIPMLLLALVIRIRMGSPIFIKQKRVGLNAKPFYVYKFRTMMRNAPRIVDLGYKPLEKVIDDPRVDGRIGRIMRKYKWDELPQLFNVIKGDMLLIGPRPYIFEENYEVKRKQSARYAIRPGISGPWQVSGSVTINPEDKLNLDGTYVEDLSFSSDFKLFLNTLRVVFLRGEK